MRWLGARTDVSTEQPWSRWRNNLARGDEGLCQGTRALLGMAMHHGAGKCMLRLAKAFGVTCRGTPLGGDWTFLH